MSGWGKFPPVVERFLWQQAVWSRLPFDVIAGHAVEQFGDGAPSADDVAAFICRVCRGKSYLRRFRRDRALSEWLLANCATGTINQIRAACLGRFGPDRTPSRTQLAKFLHDSGWRWWTQGKRDRLDAEIAGWIRQEAAGRTINELRATCIARFGAARTPSRSALHRYCQRLRVRTAGPRGSLAADGEAYDWLQRAAVELPLSSLVRAMKAGFGPDRAREKSAIQRHLGRIPNRERPARLRPLGKVPDIAAWIAKRKSTHTLDALHTECVAVFGADRAPSRSAIHRFIQSLRNSGL